MSSVLERIIEISGYFYAIEFFKIILNKSTFDAKKQNCGDYDDQHNLFEDKFTGCNKELSEIYEGIKSKKLKRKYLSSTEFIDLLNYDNFFYIFKKALKFINNQTLKKLIIKEFCSFLNKNKDRIKSNILTKWRKGLILHVMINKTTN